jgi:small GTP-binding protein
MTIGVEFFTKQIILHSNNVSMILWDITGQERFRHMVPSYMRGASGALLLFDVTNMVSFVNIGKWMNIVNKFYDNLPVVLIAAKCDLDKKTKEKFKIADYIKTSSKTGQNIDLAFETLAHLAIKAKNLISK